MTSIDLYGDGIGKVELVDAIDFNGEKHLVVTESGIVGILREKEL